MLSLRLNLCQKVFEMPRTEMCHSSVCVRATHLAEGPCFRRTVGMTEIGEEAAKPPRDQTDISHGLNALGRFFDLMLFDRCYREFMPGRIRPEDIVRH